MPETAAALESYPAFPDPLSDIFALDFLTYLPGSVLTKVDRASMAFGLEVRPPFLGNAMIDWTFSLPSNLKLKGMKGKYLLKQALFGKLPGNILNRKKQGFAIPLAQWLRGSLRPRIEQVARDSPLWRSPLLSQEAFLRWTGLHQERKVDYSRVLWALIVLDNWVRKERIDV